jgi:hypothetical protein
VSKRIRVRLVNLLHTIRCHIYVKASITPRFIRLNVAVEIFVENLENHFLIEPPKLDSRSAGVKVSTLQKRVCECAEGCVRGVLRFLVTEISKKLEHINRSVLLRF